MQYTRDRQAGLHILFRKLDISNGFWHLVVRIEDSFSFSYILPQQEAKPIQIVEPSAVQVGWVESPPLFCAVTKSAPNLTQHLVDHAVSLPPHPFEEMMKIQDVPTCARLGAPTKLLLVYVDDFCFAKTILTSKAHIPLIHWASIHSIHSFFPQLEITGHWN